MHQTKNIQVIKGTEISGRELPVIQKLFSRIPDIVFCVKDRSGCYVSANSALAERLGLQSVDLVIGKNAHELFPPHLAEVYTEQDEQILRSGKEIHDRLELIFNRDRSLGWYLASKLPISDERGSIIGIVSMSRDLQTPRDEDLRFAGLVRVVEEIQSKFSGELKPSHLAAFAGLSSTQLERRMRKVFKVSTSQFIRKTRIEAAAHQLVDTDKRIIDIAMDCGYGDQSAFTRQFKNFVGITPGAYRKAYTDHAATKPVLPEWH